MMNGIEKIISHIQAESEAECKAIEDEAFKKCEEIRARYEKAASDEYNKITEKGATDAEVHIERLGHVAALEAKKQVLATKQELVSKAFERAAEMLSELPEDDYVALLVRLASEASRSGTEQIVLNENDRARYGGDVLKKVNKTLKAQGRTADLTLSEKTRDMRGGLILTSGDIEVNCTVDTLISQFRNELSSKVATALFE